MLRNSDSQVEQSSDSTVRLEGWLDYVCEGQKMSDREPEHEAMEFCVLAKFQDFDSGTGLETGCREENQERKA